MSSPCSKVGRMIEHVSLLRSSQIMPFPRFLTRPGVMQTRPQVPAWPAGSAAAHAPARSSLAGRPCPPRGRRAQFRGNAPSTGDCSACFSTTEALECVLALLRRKVVVHDSLHSLLPSIAHCHIVPRDCGSSSGSSTNNFPVECQVKGRA